MRSKASIKGHPIHPALVAFPIAFLLGGFVCNVIGAITGFAAWWTTGAWLALAGIISAVVAAVPGFIDYASILPADSLAKQRATRHMLSNLGAVALFIIAWFIRGNAAAQPGWAVLLLEAGGVILLTMGGWLGGTLVYRNLVGVEHHPAGNGGRLSEAYFEESPGQPVEVARDDELEISQMKLLHIGQRDIVLARTEQGYVAFENGSKSAHYRVETRGGCVMLTL